MNTASKSRSRPRALLRSSVATLLVIGASHGMAQVTSVTLCAEPYAINLPSAPGVPMWGYRQVTDAATCSATPALRASASSPVITVKPGDTQLAITLVNRLAVPTSIVVAGQKLPDGGAPVMAADLMAGTECIPSPAAAASDASHPQNCRVRSFTKEVKPGESDTYTFSNLKPGTYLYQSGTHQQVQVQMGLFGMVRQEGPGSTLTTHLLGTNPASLFDVDVPVVLSEIDVDQHARINATLGTAGQQAQWQLGKNSTFDYNPRFFLINGKPYDGAGATDIPVTTFNSAYVVLRLANAGLKSRSLVLNNGHWALLTEDGNEYPSARAQYSVLLPAGKTSDARVVASVPPVSALTPNRLAFFDRRGGTDNGDTSVLGGQVAQLLFTSGGTAPPNLADLSISKTDGVTSVAQGSAVSYVITVKNNGPDAVTGATVTDTMPAALGGVAWTCTPGAGSACAATAGTGNINTTVNLPVGATATFTVNGTLSASATGTLSNTASIAVPLGFTDRVPANNSATDVDTIVSPVADLSITKTNGVTSVVAGAPVTYTIVASNPTAIGTGVGQSNTGVTATVVDNVPPIAGVTWSWTCTAAGGASCGVPATGTGPINRAVTLPKGGTTTFVVSGTLPISQIGTLSNTATITGPMGTVDPNPADNTAIDSDPVVTPVQTVLDNFDRANAVNLGANWSQQTLLTVAALQVNNNQANAAAAGVALWNAPTTGFAVKQGAAFTIANATFANDALLLKATGGVGAVSGVPQNLLRVRVVSASQIVVESSVNGNSIIPAPTFTNRGIFAAAVANGTRITAVANTNGSVDVWTTTSAGVLAYLGRSTVPAGAAGAAAPFVGGGRIGIQLPTTGARIDDFGGGTVTP